MRKKDGLGKTVCYFLVLLFVLQAGCLAGTSGESTPVATATGSPTSEPTSPPLAPTSTSPSPASDWIVYQAITPEYNSYDLFLMRLDGLETRRLTDSPLHDVEPAWSPDGSMIAYYTEETYANQRIASLYLIDPFAPDPEPILVEMITSTGGQGFFFAMMWAPDSQSVAYASITPDSPAVIKVVGRDGNNPRQLTGPELDVGFSPVWSPDGRYIAFTSSTSPERAEVYIVGRDGNASRQLASIEIDWRYPRPAWSPDGRTVAFLDTPGNVILVDVESGVQSEIGTDLATAGVALRVNDPPAWSPDGTLISFAYRYSGLEGQPAQKLCIVRVDETEATCMAEPIVYGDKPSWSPDGEYLLFFSRREGNYEIYTLEIETGLVTNLTHDPAYDGTPRWSPDGQRVVFASDRDGDLEIYMMDRSGDNLVQLTDNHIDDDCPVWGP